MSDYSNNAEPFNFECVYNGIDIYEPQTNWFDWYKRYDANDNMINRLYLWGYGEYEVWIRSANRERGEYCAEYRCDSFTIADGTSIPITIGGIPYETIYNLEKWDEKWWNKNVTEWVNNTNISIGDANTLKSAYTDSNTFNPKKNNTEPLNLNIICESGVAMVFGEAYEVNEEESEYKLQQGLISFQGISNEQVAADEGAVLDTSRIYHTFDDVLNSGDTRLFPILYTAYNGDGDNIAWGTKYCRGTLESGVFTSNDGQFKMYSELSSVIRNNTINLLYQGTVKTLVFCKLINGKIHINKIGSEITKYNRGKSIKNGDATLVHLMKIPTKREV